MRVSAYLFLMLNLLALGCSGSRPKTTEVKVRFISFTKERVVSFKESDVFCTPVAQSRYIDNEILNDILNSKVRVEAPPNIPDCHWGLEWNTGDKIIRVCSDRFGEKGYINSTPVSFTHKKLGQVLKSMYWDMDTETDTLRKIKYRFSAKW